MDVVVGSWGRGWRGESVGCGFPDVTNRVRKGGRDWPRALDEVTALVGETNGQ